MTQKRDRVSLWYEGKYIDLWTVVHFLSGSLVGFLPIILDIPLKISFVIVLVVAIIYEFIEFARGIKETITNRIVDVLVAVTGFFIVVYFYPLIPHPFDKVFGLIIVVSYITMASIGWTVYLEHYSRRKK